MAFEFIDEESGQEWLSIRVLAVGQGMDTVLERLQEKTLANVAYLWLSQDKNKQETQSQREQIVRFTQDANFIILLTSAEESDAAQELMEDLQEIDCLKVVVVAGSLTKIEIQALELYVPQVIVIPDAVVIENQEAASYKIVQSMILALKEGVLMLGFVDFQEAMSAYGITTIGLGEGEGENRAHTACQQAIYSIEQQKQSIASAQHLLFIIIADRDFRTIEYNTVGEEIYTRIDEEEMHYRSAFVLQDDMEKKVRVVLIATGLPPIING